MELVLLIIALQLVATFAGLLFLWRRMQAMSGEIARLRQGLDMSYAEPRRRRAASAVVPIDARESIDESDELSPAWARATRSWRLALPRREDGSAFELPALAPETLRALTLFLMAAVPALGFLPIFRAEPGAIVASGVTVAAAMLLIGLGPLWRAAAWAGVITGAVWALVGFVLNAEPVSFSICVTLAAAAGLAHAHLRRAAPGATLTLIMAATALALGGQLGMVGPAGIAFMTIVAMAAAVGAMTLRLEAIHLSAFGAALIGLFVLSGQESAAIWFTPTVTWMGAWFFALAVLRVPQLGAHGTALAATGALAPILAAGALHLSEHGLANDFAAAGGFAVVAAALSGLIALTALREARGVAALKLTNWVLVLGAFVALASAIFIAAPPAVAAPAFAALALGLVALDARIPDAAWRTFAIAAGGLAALNGWFCVGLFDSETSDWAAWALISFGLAAPAAFAGVSALLAERNKTSFTAGAFEALAISMGVTTAALIVRAAMSAGAPLLHPISFVEAGLHVSVWLTAALLLGSRLDRGAGLVRRGAVAVLGAAALVVTLVAGVLWLTPFWGERAAPSTALLNRDSIGFLLPGILYWLHWVLWRARGADLPTRLALGAGAFSVAAFVTVEVVEMRAANWAHGADWLSVMTGAVLFAAAVGLNFAPGVVNANSPRQLDLEEYLKRNRRSQQRRQAR